MHEGGTGACIVWVGGLIGAFFTGIYAMRLMRLVFYGEQSDFAKEHLHTDHGEAPWTMFLVVAALAVGAMLVGLPVDRLRRHDHLRRLAGRPRSDHRAIVRARHRDHGAGLGGRASPAAVLVWRAVRRSAARIASMRRSLPTVATIAEHKFYWDELYDNIGYAPVAAFAGGLYRFGGALGDRGARSGWRAPSAAPARRHRRTADRSGAASTRPCWSAGAAVLAVYFLGKANL